MYENNFITDLEECEPLKKDQPFRYHGKLLELLIATTLISAEKSSYDPNSMDIDSRDNFTISVSKLKKQFKATYLLHLMRMPDSFTEQIASKSVLLMGLIKSSVQ